MGSIDTGGPIPITVHNHPIGEHRPIRVACIGAGYSGLMMAIIASQKFEKHRVDFQIYEAEADLGGTWLVNRQVGLYYVL